MSNNLYTSPFVSRYASIEMSYVFSPTFKYILWRKLWVALARGQQELGLPITKEQISSMEACLLDIPFERVAEIEKENRHDVMAHILAFGEQCKEARGIIHLGATSSFVTDNADLIQMKFAFQLVKQKLITVLRNLVKFAEKYQSLACLSFTHLQAAQPTTVGKRASLWIQDFLCDLEDIDHVLENMRFLGVKGATGTQASFLALFNHDPLKVKQLDTLVAKEMGFSSVFTVTSQTYPRKQDMRIFSALAGLGASSHKFATDIRLLAHMKEIEEPSSETQVGSSAMPYKRNPMRSERVCGMARYLISLQDNPAYTAATQWLERSLDDSSNRRLSLAEGFLTADSILELLSDITPHLIVYPKMILHNLNKELPFLASENILMAAVKKGKDRQKVHERLRMHSIEAATKIKVEGKEIDYLELLSKDSEIGLSIKELLDLLQIKHFVGNAEAQTVEFLLKEVIPLLKKYQDIPSAVSGLRV